MDNDVSEILRTLNHMKGMLADAGHEAWIAGSELFTIKDSCSACMTTPEQGMIAIEMLETEEGRRGHGAARRALNDICTAADAGGYALWLEVIPEPEEDLNLLEHNTERLRDFYARHGFETMDNAVMIRYQPNPAPCC